MENKMMSFFYSVFSFLLGKKISKQILSIRGWKLGDVPYMVFTNVIPYQKLRRGIIRTAVRWLLLRFSRGPGRINGHIFRPVLEN